MPLAEQAEVHRAWAEAAAVKLRLCSCAGCAALALATVATCHHACEALFEATADADASAAGWHGERAATGAALCAALLLHVQLFLALPAQAGASKARMETAEQCLAQWDALLNDDADLTMAAADHQRDQVRPPTPDLSSLTMDQALYSTSGCASLTAPRACRWSCCASGWRRQRRTWRWWRR